MLRGSFDMCGFLKKLSSKLLIIPFLVVFLATPAFAKEKKQYSRAVNNDYPIVLVHGFMGWGRDEVLGFKYWGGFNDIQQALRNKGFKVYTASVGPISSNWDRACELYAYIKGGRVDYGEAHSKKNGHLRYGKYYPGVYQEWGTKDSEENIKKVHLLGHSMGGQTIRTLVQLLEEGSQEERNNTKSDTLSPLFKGDKSWVFSVTTISTPHDGSSLGDKNNHYIDKYGQKIVCALASVTGNVKDFVYDFDIEQWGLKRKSNESIFSYSSRVWNSSIWNTKDISRWDLSPQGARELNRWVKAQPNVYYFSWTTKATRSLPITGNVVPDPIYMNPVLIPTATFIAHHTDHKGGINIDSKWFHNDGAVSVISANGPKLGSKDKIVEYDPKKPLQKGEWNHMGIIDKTDHMDIVGIGNLRDLTSFYSNIAKQLTDLQQ
ncbi:lipase [Clostridium botulinum]|uniref:triacylglycerol lipase n=2 Tax=Clostridium botulinum TaxID=1491 RepID=A0A9Q1V0S5_CLOBO|nr:lipase [Clostridium botulinum BKT015925]KEI04527.1 lipase [Clostridium botulinum C/D str. Sp77]KLU76690.1 lipase [Clostridium botulinum V891]KOA76127.1 lipase [Clostridium botulinum]MCD3198235.1 lipase [Clostridium botulinum C/D]